MRMMDTSGPGPASYNTGEAFNKLRPARPCMAILRPSSVFKDEGSYEMVNNMMILRRDYIGSVRRKKEFDLAIRAI